MDKLSTVLPFIDSIYYIPTLGIKLFFFLEYICLLLKRKENQTQHEVNMATLFYKYKIRILKQICKREPMVGMLCQNQSHIFYTLYKMEIHK